MGKLPNEVDRGIKAEDFGWGTYMPRHLKFLCLNVIAKYFTLYSRKLFEQIKPMNTVYLTEILSISLPIHEVIHVPDGEYWRRRSADAWPDIVWNAMLGSCKKFYLTGYVSETVENLEPGYVDETELVQMLEASSAHVNKLVCKQLRIPGPKYPGLEDSTNMAYDPIHVDLELVLSRLKNVETVSLIYGIKKLTGYSNDLNRTFRFHIDDMDTLGRGLMLLKNLTSLAITKSDLHVIKFNRLLPYLTECSGLQEIDFSFCKLQTPGGKSVAHYIKTAKNLKLVNLCGNKIGPSGVESLAFVTLWRRNNAYPAIALNLSTFFKFINFFIAFYVLY